jgi:CRISPR/Cas system-associated endoribonuclease Cas2
MSKHWTKKLKEENAKLKADLYKILDGDLETIIIYKTVRKCNKDFEMACWMGSPNNTNI